jgi:two-component system OmpR family sensor kinase
MNNRRSDPQPAEVAPPPAAAAWDGAAAAPLGRPTGLSLRLRLMLMLLAVFGTIQVSMSVVRLLYVRRTANALVNERMADRVDRVIARLATVGPPYPRALAAGVAAVADPSGAGRLDAFDVSLFSPDGTPVPGVQPLAGVAAAASAAVAREAAQSGQVAVARVAAATGPSPSPESPATTTANAGVPQRLMARPFAAADGRPYVVVAAAPDVLVQTLWDETSWHTVVTTLIGLAAAVLGGWLIAGVAVRPIQQMSQFAAGLRPETLQDPIELGEPRGTELAALAAELDRMRHRLETGYEAQERFVANVSHEVKTPIATVLTEAQTLSRVADVPAEVRQFIHSTQDEMRRLGRLVESFLLLTRVRHGKPLQSTARTVAANDILMDSVGHCWKMAEQYGVTLSPELAEEQDRPLVVRGDPELLRTMVDNLVRNAIRFSPKGQPILVRVRHAGETVMLCVADRGPGIPPALADKIFDRFSQAKSEEKLGRGSGLGLEIAQGIAELHGGRISVSNPEGGGSEFCATLPVYEPASTTADATPSAPPRFQPNGEASP